MDSLTLHLNTIHGYEPGMGSLEKLSVQAHRYGDDSFVSITVPVDTAASIRTNGTEWTLLAETVAGSYTVRSNVDRGDRRPTIALALVSFIETAYLKNLGGVGFQQELLEFLLPDLARNIEPLTKAITDVWTEVLAGS